MFKLICCFLLYAVVVVQASRGNLMTHCGGQEFMEIVNWNDSAVTLVNFGDFRNNSGVPKNSTMRLIIDCITTMVTYDPESLTSNSEHCHANELPPYRLFVKAEHESGRVDNWDLESMTGGSLDQIVYSSPDPARFSLKFRNEHPQKCNMRIYFIIEYSFRVEAGTDMTEPLPVLVEITPMTAYLNQPTVFTFQLDREYPDDQMKAVPVHHNCQNSTGDGVARGGDSKELHYDSVTKSAWTHVFKTPGSYKLCYKHGDNKYEEAAQITVFGGNPNYFVVGNGNVQILWVGEPQLFRFKGQGLDARPGRDAAKMVFMELSCDDPATGGLLLEDLGPDDQENVTETVYNVTFQLSGRFRVCYKPYGQPWVEVPDIDDLPDDVATPLVTPPPGKWSDAPVTVGPTARPTLKPTLPPTCGTAPPREDPPTYLTKLQVTVHATSLPVTLTTQFASLLCLPENVTIIDSVSTNTKDSKVTVGIFVRDCTPQEPCYWDARERMNYILYKWNTDAATLFDPRIQSIVEVPRGVDVVDDSTTQPHNSLSPESRNAAKDSGASSGGTSSSSMSAWHIVAIIGIVCAAVVAVAVAFVVYLGRQGYASPMQAIRNVFRGSDAFDLELEKGFM
eukprot:PhF_6_TR30172/c0_g1_i1/m.44265